jgi:nucleotide-binding universal stress UspA family protein
VLEQLAAFFKATVYIVRIINDEFAEAFENRHPAPKYSQLQQSVGTHYEYCKENNIVDALNKTVDLHKADMLVVIPHKHLLIEKLFFKSISKATVEKAQCPVLVLPEGRQ